MGFYLPSEVSRLVLSYLLDHDLQETSTQFLEECPFLQELRQVSPEDLEEYTRVNGRSLMEILREYKTLLKTITLEYKQINPNSNFEAPQRMLDLVLEQRKTSPNQPQNKLKKITQQVNQPIRPKPFPGFTPSSENTQNKRRSLQSGATPLSSATPLHNITINLPPLAPQKNSPFQQKLKSPVKKVQATSATESSDPNSLVINTQDDASKKDVQNEDEAPILSTSKTKSSTNSSGKIGSRKAKKPVRRGTKTDQTDDEFLAELLGKPIAEMLDASVMKTKGQDQEKAISVVATNILTPSLLGLLADVVDLDQIHRPKVASSSTETESRLSTPDLCGNSEESASETTKPSVKIMPSLPQTLPSLPQTLPSLPQTPLPLSELGGTSTLSTLPPTFIMPSSSAVTSSDSSSKLFVLQASSDNTITLTPGTVQYQQFAEALNKIPAVEDLPKKEDLKKVSPVEKADPLAQLISATITNSPNEAEEGELDLTNVPVDIVDEPLEKPPPKSSGKSAKTRKRKLSTPKHLGAGKKSKSNEVTEDQATTDEADKQILDKFQIQLQAVIGGVAKPMETRRKSTKKTDNQDDSSSMLEKVATLSKSKGPLGKENLTITQATKEGDGAKMLILTPISLEEIQRKEREKRKPPVSCKKVKSPRPMPPSPHIRNLVFSPPKIQEANLTPSNKPEKASTNLKTPEKSKEQPGGLKILSPGPSASPLRRTDSSWNREIKIMFREQSNSPFKAEGASSIQEPSVPLPTSPLPLSEVASTPSKSQPSVEALTQSLEASMSSEVSIRQSSPGRVPDPKATPKRGAVKPAEKSQMTPQIIPRKILIPIKMSTVATDKDASHKVTSSKKLEKKRDKKSPTLKPSWDERMRCSLGAAETNMDHILKRYSENSPSGRRRRSPRKKRKQKESPTHEFSDEDESLPEIQLEDGKDVSPDSQKILDYLQKSLLEQLEKNEAVGDSSDSDDDENQNEKDNSAFESPGVTDMPILANSPNKALHKQATKTLNRAITSVVATKKPQKTKKNTNKKEEPAIEKNLESTEKVSEIAQQETGQESDPNVTMHTIKPETTIDFLSQPVIFANPDDAKFKTPQKADTFTFKTPRKSPLLLRFDESPRKSPKRGNSPEKSSSPPRTPRTSRTPHIPVSPFNLLSPAQRKRAVPLTPSRSSRTRHESTLDTPVLKSPGQSPGLSYPLAPTTPRGNKTPSAPYYTPSPSTRDSFPSPGPKPGDTPGLQFLLEEGQKLSGQSEDSMSPAKASGRSCRKSFRNMFKKSTVTAEGELGTMLEKQISKYSFDHKELQQNDYATFKSPDAGRQRSDYTSSPHILLRPSSTQASPVQVAAADGNASFVSPNRTCYLSPTAMAMSSSFLGLDYNKPPLDSTFPTPETTEIPSTINPDEFTEAQSSILEVKQVSGEVAIDFANLSDTEQSADFSKIMKSDKSTDENIKFPVLELSEDSNSGDDEGAGTPNISQINRRGNTFIEAFQEVKKKDSAIKEIKTDLKKPPVKWSPRKPRRMILSNLKSTKRSSTLTLTNDSSSFEAQFDVHNLDAFQTSVQNYSEDTSSSMDMQFESPPPTPIQTQPKRKSASPKKTPSSPTLTVKITAKKMDEKRKSAEKMRRKIEIQKEKEVKVTNTKEERSPKRTSTKRCNDCEGCKREDCGTCEMCRDRPKFGGPNKRKQACLKRICLLNNPEAKAFHAGDAKKWDEKLVIFNEKANKDEKRVEETDEKGTKINSEEKKKDGKIENVVKKKEEEVSFKGKIDKNGGKATTRKSNPKVEKSEEKENKEDTRKSEKEINATNSVDLGKTGTKNCDEKHLEIDSTRSRSTKNKEDVPNKNRRGRSKDNADSKLSSGTRRGRSSDKLEKHVGQRSTETPPPSDDDFDLDIVESSTAKVKQNWSRDGKKCGNKNPPKKSIEEKLVKLNQELTLQFSPRKSTPPSVSRPSSPVPEVYSAVGLVRSPSKRKAEASPQSRPEKSLKLMKSSDELSDKKAQNPIEITPSRMKNQSTPRVPSPSISRVLSPNIPGVSPPRTRKALASYSPKKAKKEEISQKQRRDSPQKQKHVKLPKKMDDLPKKRTDNLAPKHKSENPQKLKSDVSLDVLAASASQIMKNINFLSKARNQEENNTTTTPENTSKAESKNEEFGECNARVREESIETAEGPFEDESDPRLEVSEMFIFQKTLPFGVFEDDL